MEEKVLQPPLTLQPWRAKPAENPRHLSDKKKGMRQGNSEARSVQSCTTSGYLVSLRHDEHIIYYLYK